jgi:hypothetical protein
MRQVVSLMIDASDVDDFEIFKTGDRISVRHPSRWGRRGRYSRVALVPPAAISSSFGVGDMRPPVDSAPFGCTRPAVHGHGRRATAGRHTASESCRAATSTGSHDLVGVG